MTGGAAQQLRQLAHRHDALRDGDALTEVMETAMGFGGAACFRLFRDDVDASSRAVLAALDAEQTWWSCDPQREPRMWVEMPRERVGAGAFEPGTLRFWRFVSKAGGVLSVLEDDDGERAMWNREARTWMPFERALLGAGALSSVSLSRTARGHLGAYVDARGAVQPVVVGAETVLSRYFNPQGTDEWLEWPPSWLEALAAAPDAATLAEAGTKDGDVGTFRSPDDGEQYTVCVVSDTLHVWHAFDPQTMQWRRLAEDDLDEDHPELPQAGHSPQSAAAAAAAAAHAAHAEAGSGRRDADEDTDDDVPAPLSSATPALPRRQISGSLVADNGPVASRLRAIEADVRTLRERLDAEERARERLEEQLQADRLVQQQQQQQQQQHQQQQPGSPLGSSGGFAAVGGPAPSSTAALARIQLGKARRMQQQLRQLALELDATMRTQVRDAAAAVAELRRLVERTQDTVKAEARAQAAALTRAIEASSTCGRRFRTLAVVADSPEAVRDGRRADDSIDITWSAGVGPAGGDADDALAVDAVVDEAVNLGELFARHCEAAVLGSLGGVPAAVLVLGDVDTPRVPWLLGDRHDLGLLVRAATALLAAGRARAAGAASFSVSVVRATDAAAQDVLEPLGGPLVELGPGGVLSQVRAPSERPFASLETFLEALAPVAEDAGGGGGGGAGAADLLVSLRVAVRQGDVGRVVRSHVTFGTLRMLDDAGGARPRLSADVRDVLHGIGQPPGSTLPATRHAALPLAPATPWGAVARRTEAFVQHRTLATCLALCNGEEHGGVAMVRLLQQTMT